MGAFDLPGGPFLQLYIALLLFAVLSAVIIPRWLLPEGRDTVVRDPDRLAWLGGGPVRLADTVVARLMSAGVVSMTDRKKFWFDRRDAGRSDVERRLLSLPVPARWSQLERAIGPAIPGVQREMIGAGLAMDEGTIWQLRFWQTSPLLLLLVFGMSKREIGILRDRPVEDLTGLLTVTLLITIARFVVVRRCTRAGERLLAEMRSRSDRLRRAPTSHEVDLAVALFGTVVLAGSPWADFHHLRSSDGGSSGGGDGSGCGGGGCGGCGG
jgi:uncharacterized protein (TIGR04222 family)